VIEGWVNCIKEAQAENVKSEREPTPEPTPEPSPRKIKPEPVQPTVQPIPPAAPITHVAPKKEERDSLIVLEAKKSSPSLSPLSPRSKKTKKVTDSMDAPKDGEKSRSDLGRSKSTAKKKSQ
jgi:hypothetical protein